MVPESQGLADNEAYFPTMVQGVLVGDFTKFSAMKVLDRQNLEKVIAEGESGYYADETNFVQLGNVANVRYILNGALQKTGSGFSLQLKVTDAVSGESRAAYTGNVPATELEDLSGVKKASAELLAQLGVSLTDEGKAILLGAASSSAVQAETALARGITAQRGGTVIEALSYYYEAAKFDPSLAEAASRSSVLSVDIQGGNIGQDIRNDIQRRAAWVKVLEEASVFFKDHPPYEFIYDPALTAGRITYAGETAEISFEAKLIGTTGFRVIYDLNQGLGRTGRSRDWGIGVDSIYRAIPDQYEINAALINEGGETIGQTTGRLRANSSHDDLTLRFSGVDVDKITDRLTVSIVSINGMDAKTAGERGYMSISAEDFTALNPPPFEVGWMLGGINIVGYTDHNRDLVIPSKISRWPVTSIGGRAFYGNPLNSVVIPDSVILIGSQAFYTNPLTSIVIPDSVIAIGSEAFCGNKLNSVVIPNSVISIGDGAFFRSQVTKLTIGNGVTSIGSMAFAQNQLTSVTIPNSVIAIGDAAFSQNRLTSIVIPDSVKFIGDNAFGNALASVTIPGNVQWDISSISTNLKGVYESNGKKAGTYVLVDDSNVVKYAGYVNDNWRVK
ncbi:MAG: leucine-rich repeat domain-containing protein [Spirochaetaceae bacterium]|nr:leucine-rich repeat domain-containing protein [Spirochaetaceae bacterium]